jgi:hypothetical protein
MTERCLGQERIRTTGNARDRQRAHPIPVRRLFVPRVTCQPSVPCTGVQLVGALSDAVEALQSDVRRAPPHPVTKHVQFGLAIDHGEGNYVDGATHTGYHR